MNEDFIETAKRRLKTKDLTSVLSELLERVKLNTYSEYYTAIVEDNLDPIRMGRVRIRCIVLHDDMSVDDLPWATPSMSFVGSRKGSFIVPTVGTIVNVYFDGGDIYNPVYTGKIPDLNNHSFDADHTSDYPNNMIFFETDRGDFFRVNRRTGESELNLSSGLNILITENGRVELKTFGEDTDSSTGGSFDIDLSGDFVVTNLRGNTTIKSNNVSVESYGETTINSNYGVTVNSTGTVEINTNNFSVNPLNAGVFKGNISSPEETAMVVVTPNPTGGPLNCLLFDPLTGVPHQGMSFNGVAVGSKGLELLTDDSERALALTDTKTYLAKDLPNASAPAPVISLVPFNPLTEIIEDINESL